MGMLLPIAACTVNGSWCIITAVHTTVLSLVFQLFNMCSVYQTVVSGHYSCCPHPSPLNSSYPSSHSPLQSPLLPSCVQVIVVWGGKGSMPQRLQLPPLPVPLLTVPQPFSQVSADSMTVAECASTLAWTLQDILSSCNIGQN